MMARNNKSEGKSNAVSVVSFPNIHCWSPAASAIKMYSFFSFGFGVARQLTNTKTKHTLAIRLSILDFTYPKGGHIIVCSFIPRVSLHLILIIPFSHSSHSSLFFIPFIHSFLSIHLLHVSPFCLFRSPFFVVLGKSSAFPRYSYTQ